MPRRLRSLILLPSTSRFRVSARNECTHDFVQPRSISIRLSALAGLTDTTQTDIQRDHAAPSVAIRRVLVRRGL